MSVGGRIRLRSAVCRHDECTGHEMTSAKYCFMTNNEAVGERRRIVRASILPPPHILCVILWEAAAFCPSRGCFPF